MSEVKIIHFPQMDITKNDLVLEIHGNDGYLGRLYISKGSIDFLPKDKHYNMMSMPWDKFVRVIEKLDKKRKKKIKERKKEAKK